MNNITLGQYIPGNSWLHRLDPRMKLIILTIMLVATFIIPVSAKAVPLGTMIFIFVGILVLIYSADIPLRKVFNGLRPIVFLLVFTFFIQLFYVKTGTLIETFRMHLSLTSILSIMLFVYLYNITKKYIKTRILYFFFAVFVIFFLQWLLPYVAIYSYDLPIYSDGLLRAGFIFLRITNIIMMTSLLTFTTMTTDLNFGIESLLRPLKVIKVPIDVIAMMLSLTLRYIPTLLGETEKIMKAQASRGVDFKEARFKDKVIQIISLLIPVFVISFKRAEDLGNAMEVRGYVIGQKRTRIDEYQIGFNDVMALIVSIGLFALILYFRTQL